MHSSSRFNMSIAISVVVILIVGFALFCSPNLSVQAAGTISKHSKQPKILSLPLKCDNWNVIPSQNLGNTDELYGVAAVSVSNVWSVGNFFSNNIDQTLVENWNGTNWNVISSPNVSQDNNFLSGVANVPGTNQLWAVGNYYDDSKGLSQTLVEHWGGTNWSIVSSANIVSQSNRLDGIAAISTNDAWAIGYTSTGSSIQTLVEHWDGTSWNIVTGPNEGTPYSYLYGITAVSANDVWAVGSTIDNNNAQHTLTEQWNGKKWRIITNPSPSGATGSMLSSVVHILGSNRIWAVGFYSTSSATDLTLVEYWNGTSWNIISSPNPGSANNFILNILYGVAAVSANNIWAVGSYYNSSGYQTLVEHWDGISWNVVSSPTPGSGQNMLLSASRIPGTNKVWAVGFYDNISSYPQTLTEFNC